MTKYISFPHFPLQEHTTTRLFIPSSACPRLSSPDGTSSLWKECSASFGDTFFGARRFFEIGRRKNRESQLGRGSAQVS